MDATGAENHCTILAIEPSALDKNLIWAGTDDGNIQVTQNGGETWTNVSKNIKNMPNEAWVAQIRASKFNKGEAYVVVNNYRQFDFKTYLFRTRDYGKTWVNLVEGKPETFGYVLSVIQDLEEPNLLFLGTEYGLYVSIDEGKNWTKWTNDFPTVSTMDLAIHPREHDLIIGTFGRAAYVLDDIRPFRALAKNGTQVLNETLYLFTPPNAFITENQEAAGTRFGANAIFNGKNRDYGAMITYSINKPKDSDKKEEPTAKKKKGKKDAEKIAVKKEEKPAVKFDSIYFEVYAENNKLLRTIKQKVPKKNGVHRVYWYMDEKGKSRPSRKLPKKNQSERGGVTVLPGTYTIKIHYANKTVSKKITVAYDPRVEMSLDVLKAKYDLQKQIEAKMDVAGKATQELLKSKEIVEDYQKRIKAQNNKEKYKNDLIFQKETLKKINELLDEMLGEEDKRQGITATEFPSTVSYLYTAQRYVRSLLQKPGSTELTLVKNADTKVSVEIKKINKFFKTDWMNYQSEVEKLELSPFKEVEELKY